MFLTYLVYSKSYQYGGKYWYGKSNRLSKLLSTNKELIRKKTRSLAYLWPKLAKRRLYRFIWR